MADVNPAGTFGPISQIVALGDVALFVADDGVHGEELWRSDGTSEGTQLLADLNPGGGSSPLMMAPLGDFWLFTADDGEHGRELWRTDGTPEGTELFWESAEGAASRFVFPSGNAVAQSSAWMYFSVQGAEERTEIWRTDGTFSGTRLLRSLEFHGSPPSSSVGIREMAVTSDETLYVVYDDGLIGTELWRVARAEDEQSPWGAQSFDISDAIVDGRRLDGDPRELTAIGDSVYFSAYNVFFGREVLRADPTSRVQGLQRADLVPGPGHSNPDRFTEFGQDAYFFVHDAVAGRQGLWKRESDDGQYARVKELPYLELFGLGSGLDRDLVATEERLFFVASDGNSSNPSRRLWTSDGTTDGTSVVAAFPAPPNGQNTPRIHQMTALGSKLFFSAETAELGRELWISDGTIDGTRVVRDIELGSGDSLPSHLTVVGDRLFFTANDGVNGSRLWVSDGTEEGTRPIELLTNNGFGSRPLEITVAGEFTYFTADDGVHGRELWRTDGTAGGTGMVVDLVPGPGSSIEPLRINPTASLTSFAGYAYFTAFGPQHGTLYRTDGTVAGTQTLLDVYGVDMSSGTYADAFQQVGDVLYVTSGRVRSIAADAATPVDLGHYAVPTSAGGRAFAAWGDRAVFADFTLNNQTQIVITDGTSEGTSVIATIPLNSTQISRFVVSGNVAYVISYRIDGGTARQTMYAANLLSGETILLNQSVVFLEERDQLEATDVGGSLFFTVDTFRDGQTGFELWSSNGTSAGTRLVKDFRSANFDFYPSRLTALNGILYFSMFDGERGEELWRSDGTADGTAVVADIAPGVLSSFPTNLTVVGDVLYFAANDATHGAELWRSDGTSQGTVRMTDLRSGGGPDGNSYPHDITFIDGSLYFGARDRIHGDELWRIRPSDGDTNFDGQVDLSDLNNVRNHFGGNGLGDADGDGDVDLDDLNLVRNNFGEGATPASPSGQAVRPPSGARGEARERAVDLLFTAERFGAELAQGAFRSSKLRKPARG